MILGLFVAYLPLVIGITNIANLINMGPLQPVWKAFAPTLGLTVMVAMLPTFLLFIINYTFNLTSNDMQQLKLQVWYFWFLVAFVVLATAVGQDLNGLLDFFDTAASDTSELFGWFAETLPYATHFYLNFMVLQCATHCINLLRFPNLTKYVALSKIVSEETADKMSEPEDQDYYGKGSRSGRWTINLVIGIVYGTLSPPMNVVVFMCFWVQRNLSYGWLIPFAETRKPDSGGYFWVQMCKHTYYGLMIYWMLMVGVFSNRADGPVPSVIAALSGLLILWYFRRFHIKYAWEKLPYSEVVGTKGRKQKFNFPHPVVGEYKQKDIEMPAKDTR